jgi:hypothetical protein
MERPVVAFGPAMPGWGSWEWVGVDLANELARYYRTVHFQGTAVPDCDAVVIVKHALPNDLGLQTIASDPEAATHVRVHFERNRDYFARKWGVREPAGNPADVRARYFAHLFNDPGKPLSWWNVPPAP